jgi:hypothetical protein
MTSSVIHAIWTEFKEHWLYSTQPRGAKRHVLNKSVLHTLWLQTYINQLNDSRTRENLEKKRKREKGEKCL